MRPDGRAFTQPGNIDVVWRGVVMVVVVRRVSRDGPLVLPTVIIRMAVDKGDHAAAIVGAVGKLKKASRVM